MPRSLEAISSSIAYAHRQGHLACQHVFIANGEAALPAASHFYGTTLEENDKDKVKNERNHKPKEDMTCHI